MGKGILVIQRSATDRKQISGWLEAVGYSVEVVEDGAEGEKIALAGDFDAVVSGFHLSGTGGLELVASLHQQRPRLPIVLCAKSGSSNTAIEAIRSGAFDYLTKPLDREEFLGVIGEAVAAAMRMSQPVEISQVYDEQDTLIGRSRAMTRVYKDLARISLTPATVLIRGETGTGKELIARAIYQHGHRAHRPFVAVNCAAIPESLLESELFGHEKGSFTGATSTRIGRFEQAHNATLFLDEIGDMDLSLQSKLLRVLQERTIQRVGGNHDIPVDVRVIAATHRNLEEWMEKEKFRGDLFYRLNVAGIQIPPLRDRQEDIPLLIDYFLGRFGQEYGTGTPSITPEAVGLLTDQTWPGNIRQLQNVVRKALLQCRGYAIGESDIRTLLADELVMQPGGENTSTGLRGLAGDLLNRAERDEIEGAHAPMIEAAERELLGQAIHRAKGNQAKAARWLGITRFTLREKLKAYGLHPKG